MTLANKGQKQLENTKVYNRFAHTKILETEYVNAHTSDRFNKYPHGLQATI